MKRAFYKEGDYGMNKDVCEIIDELDRIDFRKNELTKQLENIQLYCNHNDFPAEIVSDDSFEIKRCSECGYYLSGSMKLKNK